MRQRAGLAIALVVVVPMAAWEVASRSALVDPSLLPPFSKVMLRLWLLLGDPAFQADIASTAVAALIAYALAAPLALTSGFLLGEAFILGRILNPVVHFAMAVPSSVFLPIFILVFGVGLSFKVAFAFVHAYFVIVITTVAAVRSVSPGLVMAARSFGASRRQIYLRIYLPAMLPLIATGLRLGMALNILGVVLGEMYASQRGLGGILLSWSETGQIESLLATILLISVATIALNECLRLGETGSGRWRLARAGS